jgi:hypothetical protein
MDSMSITDLHSLKKTVSQSLCLAFKCLRNKPEIKFSEFIHEVFGLYRYDEVIHQSKIFNLLSRMRELTHDNLSFKTRNEMIFASGNWLGIDLVQTSGLAKLLRGGDGGIHLAKVPAQISLGRRGVPLIKIRNEFRDKTGFSRQDIERVFSMSKSSAIRLLERLVISGKVIRSGYGRGISYQFPKEIET